MRCKPGDLALVLKAVTCPEAVGRTVEVIEIAPQGRFITLPDGELGLGADGPDWWVVHVCHPGGGVPEWAIAQDHCLLPIRPDEGEETEMTEELEETA